MHQFNSSNFPMFVPAPYFGVLNRTHFDMWWWWFGSLVQRENNTQFRNAEYNYCPLRVDKQLM